MRIDKKATLADIKDFRAWLGDRTGTYDPYHATKCLVCQYMADRGFTHTHFSGANKLYAHGPNGEHTVILPEHIAEIAYTKRNINLNCNDEDGDYTYQAAAKRADKSIKEMSK